MRLSNSVRINLDIQGTKFESKIRLGKIRQDNNIGVVDYWANVE